MNKWSLRWELKGRQDKDEFGVVALFQEEDSAHAGAMRWKEV
jgi:hypothetical protein